jgi:spermidine/putrescine transport system substrate-binding protein
MPVLALLSLSVFPLTSAVASDRPELVFLTWSDYIDPEVVSDFERQAGVKVTMVYFEDDDARDDMLQESNGGVYDLAIVNGSMLGAYARRGWLEPVSTDQVPNLTHIKPTWRNAYPEAAQYAVPYFWGTLGIAWREDLFEGGMSSWMNLFRPDAALRGRIVMISQVRDLLGMALKALGYSANTENRDELAAAEQLLMAQKPAVKAYSYVALSEDSALVTGEIVAAMVFSGDALMLRDLNEHIRFTVPEEGGNLWCDYLAVLADSPRKALAYRFINYLNEPEVAARNAAFVYYATPNQAAEKFLPAEYFANPVIYPDAGVLAKSEIYTDGNPRSMKRRNEIFSRVVQ